MRQVRDDDVAVVLALPARPRAHLAVAALVELEQLRAVADDLAAGGEIRPRHMVEQRLDLRVGVLEQMDASLHQLADVVRRDVGRHAHRDAGGAVDEDVRQACGQELRLLQRAVEVRCPLDGALFQLGQQGLCIGREARLGVAHRREGFRIVRRAPVALPVHQRRAVVEGLRHRHHRFITSAVAVRVVFAEHVTDGARALLVFGGRLQAQLAHRIDDAALHGLQTVLDMRQRAVEHHVHRVVEIGLFGKDAQRQAFGFDEIRGHGQRSVRQRKKFRCGDARRPHPACRAPLRPRP